MAKKIYYKDKIYSGNFNIGGGGGDSTPVGFIGYFSSNTAPEGYLVCDGAAVSRTDYEDLFDVIGTTFGTGDGSTTFNVPNLIDKFPQGSKTVGTEVEQALPNITSVMPVNYVSSDGYPAIGGSIGSSTYKNGALQIDSTNNGVASRRWPSGAGSATDSRKYPNLRLNASWSSSIYKDGANVQPPALTLLPCIKAVKTESGGGGGGAKEIARDESEVTSDTVLIIGDTTGDPMPHATTTQYGTVKISADTDNIIENTDNGIKATTDNLLNAVLDALYPIGSYAFGIKPTIGTWEEVEGDRALWLKNTAADGTEIEQALPNINGAIRFNSQGGFISSDAVSYMRGALQTGSTLEYTLATSGTNPWVRNNNGKELTINANKSSSIYQDGANVQPNAYVMKVYKRTA